MVGQSKPRRILGALGLHGAILLYVAFAILPIYWTVKISVTPQSLLYSEGIKLWPSRMTMENYVNVLRATDFPRYFLNSVIVSVATAIVVTAVASLAGYALSERLIVEFEFQQSITSVVPSPRRIRLQM